MLETYCHEDVVATWQDGTTCQGYAGVLAEFDKLSAFIKKMTVQPQTDTRLVLHDGNLVVSSGAMEDRYQLARPGHGIFHLPATVNLKSRWAATLVKEDGRWLMVGFHASTNAFDNEVIKLYRRGAVLFAGLIGGAIGLGLGGLLGASCGKDTFRNPSPKEMRRRTHFPLTF